MDSIPFSLEIKILTKVCEGSEHNAQDNCPMYSLPLSPLTNQLNTLCVLTIMIYFFISCLPLCFPHFGLLLVTPEPLIFSTSILLNSLLKYILYKKKTFVLGGFPFISQKLKLNMIMMQVF